MKYFLALLESQYLNISDVFERIPGTIFNWGLQIFHLWLVRASLSQLLSL